MKKHIIIVLIEIVAVFVIYILLNAFFKNQNTNIIMGVIVFVLNAVAVIASQKLNKP